MIKINVDAGRPIGAESWCVAAVARDPGGAVIGVRTTTIERACSPMAAELLAIRQGLEMGEDLDGDPFVVESDCLQAVVEVSKKETPCNDLEALIVNLRSLLANPWCRGFNSFTEKQIILPTV